MAVGSGWKQFNSGDILRATQVQGYLMNQSVMYFANSSARTSGLTSPEIGQVTYLNDPGILQIRKSSGWVTIGLNPDIRDSQIMTFMQAI